VYQRISWRCLETPNYSLTELKDVAGMEMQWRLVAAILVTGTWLIKIS
jgi:hypothetical protein